MLNKYILPASILFCTLPQASFAQVSPHERLFADRVAILAINDKCHIFDDGEKRALYAFMMQARGNLLKMDIDDQRIRLLAAQAKNGAYAHQCNEPLIQGEIERVKKSYKSWRMQISTDYQGSVRTWHVARGGVDGWRAYQDIGNNIKAGFVVKDNAMSFAIESVNTNYSTARIYFRDIKHYQVPRTNGKLMAPLRNGALSANASQIDKAITKERVNSKPRNGILISFSKDLNQQLLGLDPRECFEIELVTRNGNVEKYLVEVGDMLPAFALGAEF